MAPETCPNCGADVPPKALACPECGADESTGWNDRAQSQNLGLPGDAFDYDEFVKEEFGGKEPAAPARPAGMSWLWWVAAVVLAAMFAWGLFR